MSRNIWFDYLTTAYVQTGSYQVVEQYLPGKHQMPRTTQITAVGNVPTAYPESFNREWATFVTGTDAEDKGYDPGAYGIGVNVHNRTIEVPVVRQVHLLYYYDMESTRQERTLVQVPAVDPDPVVDLGTAGLDIVADTLDANGFPMRRVFNESQYYDAFGPAGFNRFGFVLPTGMARSKVSELHSYTGSFEDVAGVTDVYTVYMAPVYITNERPLFDFIYMQKDVTDLQSNVSGISGHLLRWRGGIPSEAIAPINRAGIAVGTSGYRHDVSTHELVEADAVTKITVDGTEFSNTDAYNTGYKRQ